MHPASAFGILFALLAVVSTVAFAQLRLNVDNNNQQAVQNEVDQLIRNVPVRLFSKSLCPHSRKAKQILGKYNFKPEAYKITELDLLGDNRIMKAMQDYLQQLTGARTVPRLFIGGQFVGGASDAVALDKSGQLRQLLINAGALEGS